MNHSYPHECTLHLRSCARKVFEVQLNKNNTCALLSCILSIVSSHWLQHARRVRKVYECMIIGLHPSWQHMDVWCHLPCCSSILYDDWFTSRQDKDVWCHLPCCLPYYMMTSLHHDKTKMFDATFPAAFHTVWLLVYIHHDNTWMFDVMFPDAFHIVWWLVYIRHDNT